MTTVTAFTHSFGRAPGGEEIILDLQRDGHALIVGPTGSGKTVAAAHAARNLVAQGAEVTILDPHDPHGVVAYVPDLRNRIIADQTQQLNKIKETHDQLRERYESVKRGETTVGQLSDHPQVLILDPFTALLNGEETPNAREALKQLLVIAKTGKSAAIHLIVVSQRVDMLFVGGEMRDNFACRVQFGNLPCQEAAQALWGTPSTVPSHHGPQYEFGLSQDIHGTPFSFLPTQIAM